MRKAILVLGMHRSGTSALAGALVRAGAAAPKNLMEANFANERGYFESLPFMILHNEILAAAGTSWRDWRPFPRDWRASVAAVEYRARAVALLREEFGAAPLFVLKDPRICRFVPFWLDVLRQARIAPLVVVPFRLAGEVAASHAARDGMPVAEGLLMWLRHVLDAERDTRGLPRAFVAMDDLLGDWRSTLERIGRDLRLVWPSLDAAGAQAIDAFLSVGLKHHSVGADARIEGWTSRVYDALGRLARNPASRVGQRALAAVAAEFEQACSLFGPLVAAPWAAPPQAEPAIVAVEPPDADRELRRSSAALRRTLEHLRAQAADAARAGQRRNVRMPVPASRRVRPAK